MEFAKLVTQIVTCAMALLGALNAAVNSASTTIVASPIVPMAIMPMLEYAKIVR